MLTFNSEFNGLKGPHCRIQTSHKKFINPILPGREIEFKHQTDKNKSRSALFSVSNLCYQLSTKLIRYLICLYSDFWDKLNVMVLGLNSANQFKETFVSISLLIVAKRGKKNTWLYQWWSHHTSW